jgi:DNA-binding transcriptional regulator YdaS (Cro superfamily)
MPSRTLTWLTEDEARALLFRKVQDAGSQKAVAKLAGVSESFVSMALLGQKALGPKLSKAIGLMAAKTEAYRYLPIEE